MHAPWFPMALLLGFVQQFPLTVLQGSCGYFQTQLGNDSVFLWVCLAMFLPSPIAVVLQIVYDKPLEKRFGIHALTLVRIVVGSLLMGLMLMAPADSTLPAVVHLGTGCAAASTVFIIRFVLDFSPTSASWKANLLFSSPLLVAALFGIIFLSCHFGGVFEGIYGTMKEESPVGSRRVSAEGGEEDDIEMSEGRQRQRERGGPEGEEEMERLLDLEFARSSLDLDTLRSSEGDHRGGSPSPRQRANNRGASPLRNKGEGRGAASKRVATRVSVEAEGGRGQGKRDGERRVAYEDDPRDLERASEERDDCVSVSASEGAASAPSSAEGNGSVFNLNNALRRSPSLWTAVGRMTQEVDRLERSLLPTVEDRSDKGALWCFGLSALFNRGALMFAIPQLALLGKPKAAQSLLLAKLAGDFLGRSCSILSATIVSCSERRGRLRRASSAAELRERKDRDMWKSAYGSISLAVLVVCLTAWLLISARDERSAKDVDIATGMRGVGVTVQATKFEQQETVGWFQTTLVVTLYCLGTFLENAVGLGLLLACIPVVLHKKVADEPLVAPK
uniref:Uncharacterized protein n=1 Tax=Chromera velia CCMP2878 TaxID=1169474 RepID=A0A0G4G7U1_9ALVE|eukprot:Cvel_20641.t1-p1 / transcript=Cvel_20641.t1 / gene=Cvel_20641 / organism=Chromera_velia_CCMP2878 / gene_product=hypothetical protein / transcript_product=hypothetical protein / location=Cvel_scaffold1871:30191-35567(+) / protein_length=561 / sequence_SO=supercontig / SO=protein_coding / is_pseudo=false